MDGHMSDAAYPAGVGYFSLHQFRQLVAYSCIVADELPSPPESRRPVSILNVG